MTEILLQKNQILPSPHSEVPGFNDLKELALNLRWSWNHASDKIWQQLDPALWDLTHNPWVVLQTVSRKKLEQQLSDPNFREAIENLMVINKLDASSSKWFQENYPKSPLNNVAYFSMEFMLTEALPIYSGGLGNVAGDQLKAASDLGVPVSAIGLLYQQGYFRQVFDKKGAQQALYPYNDPGQLPITPLRKADGEWLRLEVQLPGYSLWLRTWQVQVGRVKLYLLDSNDAANFPAHRGITSELYGGGGELRLMQELLLGIGGWRLLKALNIQPEVCHLNEGHAAFVVIERALSFMKENGVPFQHALAATRAGNLFTTHTAVPAGFDAFHPSLIEKYLGRYAENQLGIEIKDLLALGRKNPNDSEEFFNMAYLATRGSSSVNGVSRLHERVSKQIFMPIFPRWPEDEVPIGHVTNGVHMPSWDFVGADNLWTEHCGKCRWLETTENLEEKIHAIPIADIWHMRTSARVSLIEYARKRLSLQLAVSGASLNEVQNAKLLFDPNILTLGFARRFATYKRPCILLQNPERLIRILTNPERPVQLIIAGKAHPADQPGQALIQEWNQFIKQHGLSSHIIFLSDYDMLLTERLVQGVDVWINTPKRPWEACGTSGMKVLVNGGLNLSELDGWWAEAYTPEVGWALGDRQEHKDNPNWDIVEASELYELLENQVVPDFYNRDDQGIPRSWVAKIRESMARLTPRFSSNRAVREYTTKYYLPAAANYCERAANKGALSKKIVYWQQTLKANWIALRFSELRVTSNEKQHEFKIHVYLNDLTPNMIKVELYANNLGNTPIEYNEMTCLGQLPENPRTYIYRASVPALYPASFYTPRIIPHFPGVAVPLEANEILWQK